jgi:drug/metabolite transporter (DMT)-like permease
MIKLLTMSPQHKGVLSIFISCFFFALMTIAVKGASAYFSGPFIAFVRFSIGAIAALSCILLFRHGWKVADKRSWLLRGLFGGISMLLFFIAIQLTSSGRASLLANTSPVFAAICGTLFFKEQIKKRYVLSLVLCGIGVCLVFIDGNTYSMWGNLAGLGSGITAGLAIHYIRRVSQKNSIFHVYLSACIFGFLCTLFTWPEVRLLVPGIPLVALLLIAALAFIGQMVMAFGYRFVTASRGSIIGYSETLMTVTLSVLLLGEELKLRFVLGGMLILVGLVLSQWQGHLSGRHLRDQLSKLIHRPLRIRNGSLRSGQVRSRMPRTHTLFFNKKQKK